MELTTSPLVLLAILAGYVVVTYVMVIRAKRGTTRVTNTGEAFLAPSDSEGVHDGSRYLVTREYRATHIGGGRPIRSFVETTILTSPREVSCRFILDKSLYRGQSHFFKPIRKRSRFGFEIGPPFWRSDEPERLERLKAEATFQEITGRLSNSPGFMALTVCHSMDPRAPARQRNYDSDVLVLHRGGRETEGRGPEEMRSDLDLLAALRDVLNSNVVPASLPRAKFATTAGRMASGALRLVILFFLVVAVFVAIGLLVSLL